MALFTRLFSFFKSPKQVTPDGPTYLEDRRRQRDLQAFKTITTILSLLPRKKPITSFDNLNKLSDKVHRQELKILEAIALLAVSDDEVVATVANAHFPVDKTLRLMVCTNDSVDDSTSIISPNATKSQWSFSFMLTNYFAHHVEKENFRNTSRRPSITHPSEPSDLVGRNAFDYMLGLEHSWIKPTLSTHLWILSNVLIGTGRASNGRRVLWPDISSRLSRYVASTSYKKIARRVKLSLPYIEFLRQVTDIPAMSQPRRELGKEDRPGMHSDRLFMEYVKIYTDCPDNLETPIPNLIKMANSMPSKGGDFQLYTNETSTEFHYLLLELLSRFKRILDTLVALDEDEGGAEDSDKVAKFNLNVECLRHSGYALQKISRGLAFQMHLENIKPLLQDPRPSIEEHDAEELEAIHSFPPPKGSSGATTLVKSYVDWLRLIAGHFNAVETLLRHVTTRLFAYDSISVSLLHPPPQDTTLLPWTELFTDKRYLPKAANDEHFLSPISNHDIQEFLAKGISAVEGPVQDFHALSSVMELWKANQRDYAKIRESLSKLRTSANLHVRGPAKELSKLLKAWDTATSASVRAIQATVITQKIMELKLNTRKLSDSEKFFFGLKSNSFTGNLHCEACLASLLPVFTGSISPDNHEYKELSDIVEIMKDYGRIVGVSKRCCPTCSFLLQILTLRGDPFIVRGRHGRISACALPPWIPINILDTMITEFGTILREDLVAFMGERDDNDCNFFDSNPLSPDSSEGSIETNEATRQIFSPLSRH